MNIYNTPFIEDKKTLPLNMITEEVAFGVNVIRDIFAAFRDFFGGRSESYEASIHTAKQEAIAKLIQKAKSLKADSIVGVTFNIFTVGAKNSMVCISITGTAVKFVE
jgi:uncharacterized protein YbjQ (UPF0145 family)